jgi:hypothetical protein
MNIPRTTFRDQEGWGASMLTKVCMGPSIQSGEEMHSYVTQSELAQFPHLQI